MNEEIKEKPVILPPFKHFIMTVGAIPSSYLESMTYYEMLVWFTNYLGKTVIPAINENGEAVIELQNLFKELQDYINNYFENLDVQDEINNKLDEMAESGQLTDIIAQYLQLAGVLAYDNKNDMKISTNLVDGSICKTLGDINYNDGKGSFYRIRQVLNTDIIDDINIVALSDVNLIAERIRDNKELKVNSNIQLTLLGRTLAKNGITNQIDYNANAHYFTMSQGGCAISENLYAVCYIETNENLKSDNMSKLEIIDLRDGSIEDSVIFEGGHCNKVFYVPETEKLYTVDCYYIDSNNNITLTSNIHEFNVHNLSINRLIEPTILNDENVPMDHFDYDKVTNKFYAGSILSDNSLQINEIDFTNFEIIHKYYIEDFKKYNKLSNGVTLQNLLINNNLIYVTLTGAQVIKVYSINGNLIEILNLPKNIDSIYRNAELEGLSIFNNRFYCNGWDNINNGRNSINTFYTFSLNENSPKTENEYFSNSITLYVDKETDIWNPRGTQDLPFKEVYEIQHYLTSEELKEIRIEIVLKQNETVDNYDRFAIPKDISVSMLCNNNKVSPAIEGNVIMFNPKIYKSNPNDYPLHIQTLATLKLFNATFEEEFTNNCIIFNQGKLIFSNNNQYELTDKSKALIEMQYGGELETNFDITQIKFSSPNTYLLNNRYRINKSTINNSAIGSYDYNDYMSQNNLRVTSNDFSRFSGILVEYSFGDSTVRHFQLVNKHDYMNIFGVNMQDVGTGYCNVYEMVITLTDKIEISQNKSYDLLNRTWDTTTQLIKLHNMWLV